jgi:hypothetical protein
MSKYLISEMYLSRLEEEAKNLNLGPSVYQEKFAQWDIERFRSSDSNRLICDSLKEIDVPLLTPKI